MRRRTTLIGAMLVRHGYADAMICGTFGKHSLHLRYIGEVIGRRDGLPDAVLAELDRTIAMTAENTGMTLCLAINYGGRTELAEAARKLAEDVLAGRIEPESIDETCFAGYLSTAGMADPDLLIRTAGELRVSNFLLWQISYAELYVTEVLWPDFRAEDLDEALLAYARRCRKFGGLATGKPAALAIGP